MKLTSTNRSFGLIIKLSQSVFEEAQKWLVRVIKQTPFLHSVVRPAVELVMPAAFCCRTRDPSLGMSQGIRSRVSNFHETISKLLMFLVFTSN
jgi:hypothetical protein